MCRGACTRKLAAAKVPEGCAREGSAAAARVRLRLARPARPPAWGLAAAQRVQHGERARGLLRRARHIGRGDARAVHGTLPRNTATAVYYSTQLLHLHPTLPALLVTPSGLLNVTSCYLPTRDGGSAKLWFTHCLIPARSSTCHALLVYVLWKPGTSESQGTALRMSSFTVLEHATIYHSPLPPTYCLR